MKKTTILFLGAAFLFCGVVSYAGARPGTEEEKTLYYLGTALTRNIKHFDFSDKEKKYIISGFRDAMNGNPVKLDDAVYNKKINQLFERKRKKEMEKEKEKGEKYISSFLEKNKKAEKYDSGLVFLLLKKGKGKKPKAGDRVKVHYRGYFTDGREFDSSYKRKKPAEFPLKSVIPCWTEGLQKMRVGSKATLVCPSKIAYGDYGRPGSIPGGATLVFDVELLDILKSGK